MDSSQETMKDFDPAFNDIEIALDNKLLESKYKYLISKFKTNNTLAGMKILDIFDLLNW